MADAPPLVIDFNPQASVKKRKRPSSSFHILTVEEKQAQIASLTKEMQGLFDYYSEFMAQGLGFELASSGDCGSAHAAMARFLEESDLPFSKLVEDIYGKIKECQGGLTLASVKSGVLHVGQRVAYGVQTADADVLEDSACSSLWCWETRDIKMLPKSVHGVIKLRRTCRKKIHERVSAISEMLTALQKPDNDPNYQHSLVKASEKLQKVLGEADIRLLMDGLMQKNHDNAGEKEAKRDEKALVKQLERQKREEEKEKKRMKRELQKERMKNEKELKRLQEEAEKEERRREREESETNKQLRKQQEEAEKDQRRREKVENELKKQHAIQKQASIMERFLKRAKENSSMQNEAPAPSTSLPLKSDSRSGRMADAVTSLMDSALRSDQETNATDIRKSHLSAWHKLGHSMRKNRKQCWGIRQKPKAELVKELKLTSNTARVPAPEDDMNIEKLVDGWEGRTSDSDLCRSSPDKMQPDVKKCKRRKQLLQFDKSHRPAFYGIWPTRSSSSDVILNDLSRVVGPRNPLRKDPELDYEVDSDEEWEEEDPGESLSDCDKDEESLEEECSKVDEEDENEDGFFVPDGYLSENEGVQVDRMETDPTEGRRTPSSRDHQVVESDELSSFFRQLKYLHTVTEHALRKNQPLIITNLMHEKAGPLVQSNPDNLLSGNTKLEQMCLQALCMRGFPAARVTSSIIIIEEISVVENTTTGDEDEDATLTPGVINVTAVADLDLPTIVSTIRSCPQGINKVVESLQQKFPTAPKSQLRNKVREVSDFVDNRWQVKKEVLDKLGLSVSAESGGRRRKSIAAFFSKRCMPPPVKRINPDEISSSPPRPS